MDDDDDMPTLPADTLALLDNFAAEKNARAKKFEELKLQSENKFDASNGGKLSMDLFNEDWNASQFWYTDDTARTLAKQLLQDVTSDSCIAVVSAPSVYIALRNILSEDTSIPKPRLCLLEYDKRFEVFGDDFVFYDFQKPFELPARIKGTFDRIICDPPFLSEDCQTKTALTVRFLAQKWQQSPPGGAPDGLRFISCTGERMESVIVKLYAKVGAKTTTFEPAHSKGLSNEFRCYANFECVDWRWRST